MRNIFIALSCLCWIVAGLWFLFVEFTSARPSVDDNVKICRCTIHDSYILTKSDKPFSYSGGSSGAVCWCDDRSSAVLVDTDPDYFWVQCKFKLCEEGVELTKTRWAKFKEWMAKNKDKKFYGMYKEYRYKTHYFCTDWEEYEEPYCAGRGVLVWHRARRVKSIKAIPYYEQGVVEEVIPTSLVDSYVSTRYSDVGDDLDKNRYKGNVLKYSKEPGWCLRKEVDPVVYFVRCVL